MGETDEEIQFKPFSKKRNIRKRQKSESDEDVQEVDSNLIEDLIEIRKLRKRPKGIDAVVLANVKTKTKEDGSDDPYNIKDGGMLNMNLLKGNNTLTDDPDSVALGNTFSSETNSRNEDADMMKYIEKELAKRKGLKVAEEEDTEEKPNSEYSDQFNQNAAKFSEDMLSNQMLSGIPEVDLGIHERIRNIEATEEAKLKLHKEKEAKKEDVTSFVPVNMAVNFNQHNKRLDSNPFKKVPEPRRSSMVDTSIFDQEARASNKNKKFEMASDDLVLEKFKRQYKKH